MEFNFDYFKTMEPMKYYDAETLTNPKAQKMLNNENNNFIATKKSDGEWSMFIKGLNGEVLIRSRSLSVVTGEYGDKTAHLPHLVEEMHNWPNGTVVLGEICYEDPKKTSKDVGSILRCLAPKAIERQKNNPLVVKVFDLLAYSGVVYVDKPFFERFEQITNHFSNTSNHFNAVENVTEDFLGFAADIWSEGGEGIVIHSAAYKYQPGKRTAWDTLKIKKALGEIEVTVIGLVTPTHIYEGKSIATWPYWAAKDSNGREVKLTKNEKIPNLSEPYAVTKYWYNGWAAGIIVKRNGVEISVASGLTDDDRAWLVTNEVSKLILGGQLVAVVSAMEETEDGSLRHPILIRLRNDI